MLCRQQRTFKHVKFISLPLQYLLLNNNRDKKDEAAPIYHGVYPSFKLPEMIVEAKILEWTAAPIMNEAEQFSKTNYFFVFVSNIH